MSFRTKLILVRHGERIDEVDSSWVRDSANHERYWDPPLTRTGVQQAEGAAPVVEHLTKNSQISPQVVYTSPLLRAVMTAAEIATCLKLPLVICPGLASCAAYVRRKRGASNVPLLTSSAIQEMYPSLIVLDPPADILNLQDSFRDTITELSFASARQGQPLLCVAHREAIRELAGHRCSTPYACVADFSVSDGHFSEPSIYLPMESSGESEKRRESAESDRTKEDPVAIAG